MNVHDTVRASVNSENAEVDETGTTYRERNIPGEIAVSRKVVRWSALLENQWGPTGDG
jgi:hypothetical protein